MMDENKKDEVIDIIDWFLAELMEMIGYEFAMEIQLTDDEEKEANELLVKGLEQLIEKVKR